MAIDNDMLNDNNDNTNGTAGRKQTFTGFFREGLLETVILNQILAVIAALVLVIYGNEKPWNRIFIMTFVTVNCMGFFIKFIGALLYEKFYPRPQDRFKLLVHFLVWSIAIVLGTVIGTETGMGVSSLLVHTYFPSLFTSRHLLSLAANLLMVIPLAILIFTYIMLKKRLDLKIRENQRIKHLQTRAQLAALQAKINPHFLFNTLNAMLTQVHKAPDKVETMILNLSDIYRKVLTLPENQSITLEEEMLLIREYLEIEKIRMGDRLQYSIDVNPELNHFKIPPLLIEPLVENAVIHGISPKPEGGGVDIRIQSAEQGVEVVVMDNGVGLDQKTGKPGFGIYSIQERLNLIYKDNAAFSITQREGGGIGIHMVLPYYEH
jgi:sensor histidine kinase YesM